MQIFCIGAQNSADLNSSKTIANVSSKAHNKSWDSNVYAGLLKDQINTYILSKI